MAPRDRDPDLFLDEDKLIALAIQEMRGKRPPRPSDEGSGGERWIPTAPHQEKPSLLTREMEARGWSVRDVMQATGMQAAEVNALMKKRARMTKSAAETLARAFATSSDFWLSE